MNAQSQIIRLLLAVSLLAVFASCVESRWPLSDEKTSKIDERLIGSWKDGAVGVWTVKKSTDVKNALEVKIPDPNAPDQTPAFATTIKSKNDLSVNMSEPNAQPDEVKYEIYQYVFVDADTMELRGMNEEAIIKAIEKKQTRRKDNCDQDEKSALPGYFRQGGGC